MGQQFFNDSAQRVQRDPYTEVKTDLGSAGAEVLVTILSDEPEFWLRAGESLLASVWDNEEDDVYEQLLKG